MMFIQWRQHYIPLINEIIPEKEYIVHSKSFYIRFYGNNHSNCIVRVI
jgi:hypothetical protein